MTSTRPIHLVLGILAAVVAVSPSPAALPVPAAFPAVAAPQATDADARMAAWQEHARLDRESVFRDLEWRAIGPLQAGARVEAIAVPPGNHGTIYAGVGSGNLWKTTNNGVTWEPIFEHESTFTIGDVAVSSSDPDIVWVGTGETQPRHSGYSYAGTGVFRSTDAGRTWRHMGLTDTHHIGKILIDPSDPMVVWVAAIGHFWSRNEERGMFRTADGGETWQRVLHAGDGTGVVDAVMDPRDPDVVYAAAWEAVSGGAHVAGEHSGIYRTTDGGSTWSRLEDGLPSGPLGRIGLDVSPSSPDVVYAFVDNHASSDIEDREIVGGEVYRSDDAGETWRKVNEDDVYRVFGVFGWKFTDIRVSPVDENELFILGNRAYHSVDGGRTYERIGERILRVHDTRGEVMHLDHHEIWIDPLNPDRVLLGNDGGLYQSYDRGATWLHHNNIPAAEFYSVSVDAATPYNVFGGTQDNAALYGPSDTVLEGSEVVGSIVDPWENVYLDRWTGGDSFDTLFDPVREGVVYYEHQHGAMMRMDLTGDSVQSGGRSSVSIQPRAPEGEEPWRFGWYTPIVISHHDPRTFYVGANVLLRSRDLGESWRAVSLDLSDPAGGERAVVPLGTITFVAESPFRSGRIWVSTEGGTIWRTDDDGESWSRFDEGLPDKWVSRVIASRHDFDTAYVAMTGFREDDFSAYLFRSTDGGTSWVSIAANLPHESINVIREDPTDADILYVGTDLGVWASLDAGASWISLSASLPTTPVHDLVIHPRDAEIVIGTHGRGVFVLDAGPVREWRAVVEAGGARLFGVEPALLPSWEGRSIASRPETTYGEAIIRYALPAPTAVTVEILDAEGEHVVFLDASADVGVHVARWDLAPEDDAVELGQYGDRRTYVDPGIYTIVLHAGDDRVETTLTVLEQ